MKKTNDEQKVEDVVLLVSSKTDPYWRDIPEIVARENGAGFHFRYRSKWIPSASFRNHEKLREKKGYVVHLDGPEDDWEYLPLREVRITDTSNLGEHLRVEFVLQDLVQYALETHDGKNEYSRMISDAIRGAGQKEGYNGDYIVVCKMNPLGIDSSLQNWTRIARELVRFPTFSGKNPTIFLAAEWRQRKKGLSRPFTKSRNQGSRLSPITYDCMGRPEFQGGRYYWLHLVQYVPSEDASKMEPKVDATKFPVRLELETDESVIKPSVKATVVRGKYDDAYLAVHCEPVSKTTYGFVQLTTNSDYFNVPTLRFHEITVRRTLRLSVSAVLAAVLFASGVWVPQVLRVLASVGIQTDPSLASTLTSFLLAAAGVLVIFVSAWARAK